MALLKLVTITVPIAAFGIAGFVALGPGTVPGLPGSGADAAPAATAADSAAPPAGDASAPGHAAADGHPASPAPAPAPAGLPRPVAKADDRELDRLTAEQVVLVERLTAAQNAVRSQG